MHPPPVHLATSRLLQDAPALRRLPLDDFPGFTLEISDRAEAVYLLGRADGSEIPVPMRCCGTWNPATVSGRHFFFAHEPDVALALTTVRQAEHYIGRLVWPSGFTASPWISHANSTLLLRRLSQVAELLLGEHVQLEGRPRRRSA